MAKLNDFIAQIKAEGLMRNNRYIVNIPNPPGMSNAIDLQKVLLFCDSVSLPGVTIGTSPALTYGEVREMPYEKLFQPVSMTFYVDNSMHVKRLFDDWQGSIIDTYSRETGYYADYTRDIDITVFDVYDNTRYLVTLHEAYLKDIGQIQLDASNKDVMKLNVTMQYKYWTSALSMNTVQYPDNRGFFEKLFAGFLGDSMKLPTDYFSDFNSFQGDYNSNSVTPQLGGHSLSGASYRY